MICAYCSSAIPDNVEFCPVCGARQTLGVIHATPEMAEAEKPFIEPASEVVARNDETILSMPASEPPEDQEMQPPISAEEYPSTPMGEIPSVEPAQPFSQAEVEVLGPGYSAGGAPSIAESKKGSKVVPIILITCLVIMCCFIIPCLLIAGGLVIAFQNIGY